MNVLINFPLNIIIFTLAVAQDSPTPQVQLKWPPGFEPKFATNSRSQQTTEQIFIPENPRFKKQQTPKKLMDFQPPMPNVVDNIRIGKFPTELEFEPITEKTAVDTGPQLNFLQRELVGKTDEKPSTKTTEMVEYVKERVVTFGPMERPRAVFGPQTRPPWAPTHKKDLTFRLQGGELFCLSEDFTDANNYTLSFRVVRGGSINIFISNKDMVEIYSRQDIEGDMLSFLSSPGTFMFCIVNPQVYLAPDRTVWLQLESTFGESLRYLVGGLKYPRMMYKFRKEAGDFLPAVDGPVGHSFENIHRHLESIETNQVHYRHYAENGRVYARELHEKIQRLTVLTTSGMLLVSLVQTIALRRVFTPKSSTSAEILQIFT